jgi:hypothetical protein
MNTKSFGPFDVGHGLTVEHVYVTPEVAAGWLEFTPHERNSEPSRIARYTGELVLGQWKMTGETIRFDWDGILLNGHHRLRAIVRSGVSCWLLLVHGVDPATKQTQDTGLAKRISDWSDRKNSNSGYAMVMALIRVMRPDPVMSNTRIKNVVWDLIGDDSIQFAATMSGTRLASTASCRLSCALIHRVDPSRAESFRHRITKFDYPPGSIEHVYARQFDNVTKTNRRRLATNEAAKMALRVAIAAVRGESLQLIKPTSLADAIKHLSLDPIMHALDDERAACCASA